MKYLIRFNELNIDTYRSAGRKLTSIGRKNNNQDFKDRGRKLSDHADKLDWLEGLDKLKDNDTPLLSVKLKSNQHSGDNKFEYDLDLYLELIFFADMFSDVFEDYVDENQYHLTFCLRGTPKDEETYNKIDNPDSYWLDMAYIDIIFKVVDESIEFTGLKFDGATENGDLKLDRKLAVFLRKALIKTFSDKKVSSIVTTGISDYSYIESIILAQSGLSSDYGLSLEDIVKYIKTFSVNDILQQG